jgi:hypothetical protein
VIPAADVDRVLGEALQIEAEDARFGEQIRNEDPGEILRRGSDEC